ncbi:MAG: hypothetical protein KR126chlam6_00061 [Candidatus Anoxychlamydiales bacterium]|nr:hypothetical protein [Candidatus Anoxychlamydiales bacterium]
MSVTTPDTAPASGTDAFNTVQIKQRIKEKKINEHILVAISFAAFAYLSYIPSRAPVTVGSFLTKWTPAILSTLVFIEKVDTKSAVFIECIKISVLFYSVYANYYYLEQSGIKTLSDFCFVIALKNLNSAANYELSSMHSLTKYLKKAASERFNRFS